MTQAIVGHSFADLIRPDAEQAVLSALIAVRTIPGDLGLTAAHFGVDRNAWIFNAMQRICAQGNEITTEQIIHQLESNKKLAEVGGYDYLIPIFNNPAGPGTLNSNVELLEKYHLKRALANISTKHSELAFDSANLTSAQIFDIARRDIEALQPREAFRVDKWSTQKRTLADAFMPREPETFVVEGIIALETVNILYGAPGTLKSMVLADLLVCVAAGVPWLESLPGQPGKGFATKQAPVLWIDFDNGKRRTDNRFEAFARERGISPDVPLTYYTMPSPWLDASDERAVDALIARVQEHGAGVLVIDNLGLINGGTDENSAEMTVVMGNLRRLVEATGVALIVIHHQRKTNMTGARAGDSLRGHSSIEAALDLALLVEREEGASSVRIKSTKTRGADVAPFGALWTFQHKPDSKELETARFWGELVEDLTSDKAVRRAILDCLKHNAGITKGEIVKGVKETLEAVGVNRIRANIDRLAAERAIRKIAGGKDNAQRFELV